MWESSEDEQRKWARVKATDLAEKITLEFGLQSKISVSGRLSTEREWGRGKSQGQE